MQETMCTDTHFTFASCGHITAVKNVCPKACSSVIGYYCQTAPGSCPPCKEEEKARMKAVEEEAQAQRMATAAQRLERKGNVPGQH